MDLHPETGGLPVSRAAPSFEEAIWRELDQMRTSLEHTLDRLDKRDEKRDSEISHLRLQVNVLRSECKRNMRRDAGLVIAPTTIVTILTAVLNWAQHPAPVPVVEPQRAAYGAPAATPIVTPGP